MTVALDIACAGAAAAASLGVFAYAAAAPSSTIFGPVISRGPATSNQIALTFDDGPSPGSTDRVLDLLHDANIKATFFVIGANAKQHPDLLRRIHAEGHQIANHTLHHSHYAVMCIGRYWRREIGQTDDIIESIIGLRPAHFRPPVGARTWHTIWASRRLGHTLVTWSRRAVDGWPTTSDRILRRFRNISAGEILLLHDGVEPNTFHRDRSATIEALPKLLELIRQENLTPVRLDELLDLPAYQSRATAT